MKKIIIISVIILLGISCSRNEKSDAYGNFEAIEVIVSSEANGRILFLHMEEGIRVSVGDTLGLVDTTDLALKKEQIYSQKKVLLARARSIDAQILVQEQQKKNLLVDLERVQNLLKDGAATQKQLDDLTGSLGLLNQQIVSTRVQKESITAEMATLDIQIRQVDEALRKAWITSPLAGTILVKYTEAGEITAMGKPVCKIANLDALELKVYISGDQLPYLFLGNTVEVLVDQDKKNLVRLEGVVTWISPKAEFTPKTIQTKRERVNLVYAARIRVVNDGSLKIGMPGEINFMPDGK
ncbi:MAG: HlyD family efflux transporter periplasmic adaptor subunit [Bacteroidales bacterium]|nr:HlyD family efflux transporter periplasmic adaptor subunit [Bacteroidales bacterium]